MSTISRDDCRVAVVVVKVQSGKPIGLLVPEASRLHARSFCKHFNRRIKRTWPDRKAVAIPVI